MGEKRTIRGGVLPLYRCAGVLDEPGQVVLEFLEAGRPSERFVVAVEDKDDVGVRVGELEAVLPNRRVRIELFRLRDRGLAGQPLVLRAEVHRPHPAIQIAIAIDFVAAVSQVAKHQVVLRIAGVNQRLEPARMLHPLGQRIADNADVIPLVQLKRRGGRGEGRKGQCGNKGSGRQRSESHEKPARE